MPCVMLLLTYGSPADGPINAHFTPLLGAIEGDQGTVAKVLVSHGADANRRSADDFAGADAHAATNERDGLLEIARPPPRPQETARRRVPGDAIDACRDTDYACHAVDASRFAAHAC